LIGKRAMTVTPHNPGGMISVEGRRLHSETRGMLLDAGQEVEIVALKGNRLVIRLADSPAPPSDERSVSSEAPAIEPAIERPVEPPTTSSEQPTADPFDPFLDESQRG
jgi:hypothetical protein